jgi:hypothetical protein
MKDNVMTKLPRSKTQLIDLILTGMVDYFKAWLDPIHLMELADVDVPLSCLGEADLEGSGIIDGRSDARKMPSARQLVRQFRDQAAC